MKKNFFIFLSIIIAVNSCRIQINSKDEPQTLNIENDQKFNKLDISNAIDVIYKKSDTTSFQLICSKEMVNEIITRNNGNTFKIYKKEPILRNILKNIDMKVTVIISNPTLNAIKLSGASTFTTNDTLTSETLIFEGTGASSFSFKAKARDIIITLSGASNASLGGICKQLEIDMSGASELNAFELHHLNTRVSLSGAPDAKITNYSIINGTLSGASNLIYKGEPKNIDVSSTGASEINRK